MKDFWTTSLLSFAVLTDLVSALSTPSGHVVHERRSRAPSRWVKRNRVHPQSKFPVRVGLTQRNLENGHELLMDVYVVLSKHAP